MNPQTDVLCGDDLADLADAARVQLARAFSRVPGLPRVYVQDRFHELADTVWPLLNPDAQVYVFGSTDMADVVRTGLADLHRARTGGDDDAAEDWLRQPSTDGRYLVDVWAGG
jgi:cytochrome P450 / NADPH-cytochrome P450 reductase